MAFEFRLQTLLNVKTRLEDNLKNELGKSIQQAETERQRLMKIHQDMQTVSEQMGSKTGMVLTVGNIKEMSHYYSLLKDRSNTQKEVLRMSESQIETCRNELIKVVQEKKMLEKLREKKLAEYIREEHQRGHRLNDDILAFRTASGEQSEDT